MRKRFGPFFVEPIVAGLDPKTQEPFICNMDLIGCINLPTDFVVGVQLLRNSTVCARHCGSRICLLTIYLKLTSQALMNAFDRDAISGWGATVYIIEKDKVTVRNLKHGWIRKLSSLFNFYKLSLILYKLQFSLLHCV
ncbi:hypothetical protein NQ317_013541 [Molorchus minor]|uniref:Uncharacterized protein n=1 Tax=Molorchus minor TaxID=1323400 RepID=A0ABQ9JXA8_9CUCU|nr:hypothetical protein NQ317_013541 [Molorchus minor]